MQRDKDETDWQRQVLIGVLVLVAVGALIGGIVAVVSIKAADLAGIDDTASTSTREDRPRMSEPSDTSETEPAEPTDTEPTETTGPTGTTGTGGGPTTGGQTSKPPKPDGIILDASPMSVAPNEHINLSGTYKAPDGTVLQIQRKEGGQWVDFPATVPVSGGAFATYIYTGQTGPNQIRVSAIGRDDVSNAVTVQVG